MVNREQAKTAANKLRKQLATIDKLLGNDAVRERDAQRKRATRAESKNVVIPRCADRARRERLEADDVEWLRYYCGNLFTYEFTSQQLAMIEAIRKAIVYGGDQALAASRGEGKTKIFERMLLKYTLAGTINFAVLFASTGSKAMDSLKSLRDEIETNPLLLEDYPEVCAPVVALENTPNRAHYQLVSGFRHDNDQPFEKVPSKFSWCGDELVLPKVPGSPAAGAILATRGLDSEVRGVNKGNRRPQVACIDDPDTEDTVRSEEQAKKLQERIDRGIGGLGNQRRAVARVMLTTLQRRNCVSAWYTDPLTKPSWKGKRFRYLIKPPERMDLWDEYVQIWRADKQRVDDDGNCLDEFSRGAYQFLLDNLDQMMLGAEVANPNRFDPTVLPDGTPLETNSLQSYYNFVAKNDQETASAELDNDPPEETGPIESGISAHRIQTQLSGYERRIIPPGCIKLTCGVDCRKVALHWVVRAWREDGSGFTIDYGVHEVFGTVYGSDEGVDVALKRAILSYVESVKDAGYYTIGGEVMDVHRILIDAGWRTDAVYAACIEAGLGVQPVMGFGKSSGCTQANFSDVQRRTKDRKPGDGWFLSRRGKLWLVCADTDRWKAWEHDRWMTAANKPGCMTLFGEPSERGDRLSADEKDHHAYARHITNEVEIEEPHKGGMRRRWKAKSDNTHWLDASYYANVAANMEGIRLPGKATSAATKRQAAKPSKRKVEYL